MTTDGPRPWEIRTRLAIITALRKADTAGVHTSLCDAEELQWRRIAMDGYEQCDGGGITLPGLSRAAVELLKLDPTAYFESVRNNRPQSILVTTPRPRRSVPSTDEERAQAWVEAREVVRRERPTMLRRWLRRRD